MRAPWSLTLLCSEPCAAQVNLASFIPKVHDYLPVMAAPSEYLAQRRIS